LLYRQDRIFRKFYIFRKNDPMSDPFVGEIRMFAGNFAPRGWAFCNGQLIPISQNTALFSLLGTTYGGDGRSTFALPDLRGRVPLHAGQGSGLSDYPLGSRGGSEQVVLTTAQLPAHSQPKADSDRPPTTP
jgi:microcystin-dependent protein